jgi:hypothetical protein
MKKTLIALAALATLSTAALAERNYDISSPPYGETPFVIHKSTGNTSSNVQLFAVPAAKGQVLDTIRDDASNDGSGNSGGNK